MFIILIAMTVLLLSCVGDRATGNEEIKPANSSAQFDGWKRYSQYVAMRDGTKLAIDYYRPTRNGVLHPAPLPVVWQFTPYHRFILDENGKIGTDPRLARMSEGGEALIRNGYVFASVDVRGYGASFGSADIWIGPQQSEDAFDIMEWLVSQPWSTESIGMTGRSYLGNVQYFAAASQSPHLKAIFPEMAGFDNYNIFHTNGIYRKDLASSWDSLMSDLNFSDPIAPGKFRPHGVAPVDEDKDGALLSQAIDEHRNNQNLESMAKATPFRDDVMPGTRIRPNLDASPWRLIKDIEASKVAIYSRAGWFDLYSKDALLFLSNLNNPQKIIIGPWYHRENFGFELDTERVRWFDYWLKHIDNGIMDEPRIRYYRTGVTGPNAWGHSDVWPLKNETRKILFLSSTTKSGEGLLVSRVKSASPESRVFQVDYDTSLGTTFERNNGLWPDRQKDCASAPVKQWCFMEAGYPALKTKDDEGVLSYTSDVLPQNLLVVGHPKISIWVTSEQKDADIFAVLEEVHPDGRRQYIAEGGLRASHRQLNKPPYNNLGVPWLGNYRKDARPLPDEPTELLFELFPVSNLFEKGHRLQVNIMGADAGTHLSSINKKPNRITIYQGSSYPSKLDIPIID